MATNWNWKKKNRTVWSLMKPAFTNRNKESHAPNLFSIFTTDLLRQRFPNIQRMVKDTNFVQRSGLSVLCLWHLSLSKYLWCRARRKHLIHSWANICITATPAGMCECRKIHTKCVLSTVGVLKMINIASKGGAVVHITREILFWIQSVCPICLINEWDDKQKTIVGLMSSFRL